MCNPKIIIFSSICGFLVSFLFGLLGSVPFGSLLLRASISAAIFSGVAFGIYFLYEKFLLPTKAEPAVLSEKKRSSVERFDSLTLEEDVLPDSSSAPNFDVVQDSQEKSKAASDYFNSLDQMTSFLFAQAKEADETSSANSLLVEDDANLVETEKPLFEQNTPTVHSNENTAKLSENKKQQFSRKDIVAEKITVNTKPSEFAYSGDVESMAKAIQSKLLEED